MKERHNINAIKENLDGMSTEGTSRHQSRIKSSSTEQQFLFWSLMVLPSS